MTMKDWTLKDWITLGILAGGLTLANWRLSAIEQRLQYFERSYVTRELDDARLEITNQRFINMQLQLDNLKKEYDIRGH